MDEKEKTPFRVLMEQLSGKRPVEVDREAGG